MTPPVLYCEPDELIQGDTWQWTIQSDVYPATDGWVLTYDVTGAALLTFAATTDPDGTSYDILVTQTKTQTLTPGLYFWNAWVAATTGTYAGQRFTIRRGTFRIVANFDTAGPGAQQAFAEKMLVLIRAELLARLTGTGTPGSALQAYSLEGRSISKIPLQELHSLEAKYHARVEMLSRGGRLPPFAVNFGRRPAGYPSGAGNRSSSRGGQWGGG